MNALTRALFRHPAGTSAGMVVVGLFAAAMMSGRRRRAAPVAAAEPTSAVAPAPSAPATWRERARRRLSERSYRR